MAATWVALAVLPARARLELRALHPQPRAGGLACAADAPWQRPFRRLRKIFTPTEEQEERVAAPAKGGAEVPVAVPTPNEVSLMDLGMSAKASAAIYEPDEVRSSSDDAVITTSHEVSQSSRDAMAGMPVLGSDVVRSVAKNIDRDDASPAEAETKSSPKGEEVPNDDTASLARLAMHERDQARRARLALAERDALAEQKRLAADDWGSRQPAATDWLRRDAAELMWQHKEASLAPREPGGDARTLRRQWGEEDRLSSDLDDGDWRLDEFERLLQREQGWRKAAYRWWLKVWDASGDDYLFEPDETDDYGFPKTRFDGTSWDEPPRDGGWGGSLESWSRGRRADEPRTRSRLRAAGEVDDAYERRLSSRRGEISPPEGKAAAAAAGTGNGDGVSVVEQRGQDQSSARTSSGEEARGRRGLADTAGQPDDWLDEEKTPVRGMGRNRFGDERKRETRTYGGQYDEGRFDDGWYGGQYEESRATRRGSSRESRERFVEARLKRLGGEVELRVEQLQDLDRELAERREEVCEEIKALTADGELDAWQISDGVAAQMPPSVRARQLSLRRLEQERLDLQERRMRTWDALELAEDRLVEIDFARRALRTGGLSSLRDSVERREVSRNLRSFLERWL